MASSSSSTSASRSAAVGGCDRSMRMSSGSSRRKLNPRPSASSCIDDTPRSASAPSTRAMPRASSTRRDRGNRRARARRDRQRAASASAASPSASGSRSRPITRVAPASSSARLWPPRPTVQSTKRPPRAGSSSVERLGDAGRVRACAVHRQIPNSDSARASSSVYGSRCSFATKRSWFQTSSVVDLAEDIDVAGHPGRVAQPRMDHDASLRVDFSGLAEVVDAVEKLEPGGMGGGHARRASLRAQARPASGRCGRTPPSGSSRTAPIRAVFSMSARKAFGILSRPLSSILAA